MAKKRRKKGEEKKSQDAVIIEWVKGHVILTIVGSVLVVVLLAYAIFSGIQSRNVEEQQAAQADQGVQALLDQQNESGVSDEGTDTVLLNAQDALIQRFGEPPDGYILNWDGTFIPRGEKELTPEQVTYAYLKAISTLDMATAQKYSRDASIVKDYESYFDTSTSSAATTTTEYQQNVFKAAMLSIQVESLGDSTAFAGDKQTFTAHIKMLDLYATDFIDGGTLNKLSKEIDNRGGINSDESQGAIYLQDWLVKYYSSDKAPLTTVDVTLTVQKYPDLNTGWLVSIDKPLDDKFKIQMDQGAYYYVKASILGID